VISASPTVTCVSSETCVSLVTPAPLISDLALALRLDASLVSCGRLTLLAAVISMSLPRKSTPAATAARTVESMVWSMSAPAPAMKPSPVDLTSELNSAEWTAEMSTSPVPRVDRSTVLLPLSVRSSALVLLVLVVLATTEAPAPRPPAPAVASASLSSEPVAVTDRLPPVSCTPAPR
jgi:hypothetical protein